MRLFWNRVANVLFYVVSGSLLIYAASRSIDFITATLPPDQQIIGYLGLAATSGGMIAWLLLFLYTAEGIGQRVTAGIMTVLCMVGEFGLFTMDTLYQTGESGMIEQLTPESIRGVILALSGLIAANILATVVFHLAEPENMKRMRESSVRDQLEAKTLKEIETRGDELAQKLAPQIAKQWAEQFENRFADMHALGLGSSNTKKEETSSKPPTTASTPSDHPDVVPDEREVDLVPVPLAGETFSGNGNGHRPNLKR